MKTRYDIIISIRTLSGMREMGTFNLGDDKEFALGVFESLEGDTTNEDDALIRIDLEQKDGHTLPLRLKSIRCTLDQYAENCKIITRDIFKFFTLEK